MKYTSKFILRSTALSAIAMVITGCVLAPRGTDTEQSRLREAGKTFPTTNRTLPDIPTPARWQDVLHRAFLANGDLESAYHQWAAAVSRIDQMAAYPNSNVAIGFDYMFSAERMKSWDRTTLSAGFDPAMTLQLPNKISQAGKIALDEARVAGARFETAKFDLQRRVLTSYLDLALADEKIRIQRDNLMLLKFLMDTAAQRVKVGGLQQDLLKLDIQYRLAQNELANMESEARRMRAMLNGMLARDPAAPLDLPISPPPPRAITADDAHLIAVAVDRNPELAALAHEIAGRRDAIELARMAYIPDINPQASVTGSISQSLGAMIMLPTNIPRIRSAIEEARAQLRASEAMSRQTNRDRAAAFIAALYAMRNSERQIDLFANQILPASDRILATVRQSYAAGTVGFTDLIDAQRVLLDVRQMTAEVRIEREKRLAEMESLAGIDIESLAAPSTQPASTAIATSDRRGEK